MADFGLPLMLAGTTRYQPKPAQFLDLTGIIETGDVPHLSQDPGQNVFADAPDLQDILRIRDFTALLVKLSFYLFQRL